MSVSSQQRLVLLSGGMDSTVALYHTAAVAPVAAAVSFDYNSKHNCREIPMAAWHADHLGIKHITLPLKFIDKHFDSHLLSGGGEIPLGHYEEQNMRQTVVPFRNGIMLAIAAGLAESIEASKLVIAAHAGDHAIYPDCREPFMAAIAEAIRLGTYAGVAVERPFISMDKAAIVRRGYELGVDFSRTWSCYVGGEKHCGECGTCVERREAFLLAGIEDPTDYVSSKPLPVKPS